MGGRLGKLREAGKLGMRVVVRQWACERRGDKGWARAIRRRVSKWGWRYCWGSYEGWARAQPGRGWSCLRSRSALPPKHGMLWGAEGGELVTPSSRNAARQSCRVLHMLHPVTG